MATPFTPVGIQSSGGSRIYQMGEGRQLLRRGESLIFHKIFDENCMKIKEIRPRGGYKSLAPPGSAAAMHVKIQNV